MGHIDTAEGAILVIGVRQIMKRALKACITGKRFHSRPASQGTAPLPTDCITQASLFEVTGVDFAGSLFVKGARMTKSCTLHMQCHPGNTPRVGELTLEFR